MNAWKYGAGVALIAAMSYGAGLADLFLGSLFGVIAWLIARSYPTEKRINFIKPAAPVAWSLGLFAVMAMASY